MTAASREQLQRILRLALRSPYEGERSKAVALLLTRLEREQLTLTDLDGSFNVGDDGNTLRFRARLPHEFEVCLKSREEAQLYEGLLTRYPATSCIWLEGHRLQCVASSEVREQVEDLVRSSLQSLQSRLATAQQQAMAEYQQRRRALFAQAVAEELNQLQQDSVPISDSAAP